MITLVLLAGALALSIGIGVLWANPTRFTNQAFSGTALIVALYTLFIYNAIKAGKLYEIDHVTSPVTMLRSAAAILVFFPWLLWLQKSSLATKFESRNVTLKHSLPWLIMGIVLATLCYTEWYIPSDSNPELPKQGPAYIFVSITMIAAFAFLAGQSWYEMRRQTGIRNAVSCFQLIDSCSDSNGFRII